MSEPLVFLLLEDEPLILLDLEFAVEDAGGQFVSTACPAQALAFIAAADPAIDLAILDVNLGRGETCEAVARELQARGIPFILHSGDLDRRNETIRTIGARVVAKPASTGRVVAEAVAELRQRDPDRILAGA